MTNGVATGGLARKIAPAIKQQQAMQCYTAAAITSTVLPMGSRRGTVVV